MSYPMPGYHFQVEWGGTRLGFVSVSGLDQEIDVIEYREGNMPSPNKLLIPGIAKPSKLVMRRGIVAGDGDFQAWFRTVRMGTADRRDLTVTLLDEDHEPVAVWKVRNAWPCRLEGPSLNALNSEIAIETMEVAHEGIDVEFP